MERDAQKKHRSPLLRSKRKLQDQVEDITREVHRRNRELAETNEVLSLLSTIDALVLESRVSLKMVCQHITEALTQAAAYTFVGLLTRSSQTREELTLNGWSGKQWLGQDASLGFSRPLHIPLEHPWFKGESSTKLLALSELTDEQMSDFLNIPPEELARIKKHLPIRSLYAVKLLARRRLVGLLVVGFPDSLESLDPSDTKLLERLSESIGVALDNKLLFEENQHVVRRLQETNERLQELDQTKDDFISMASHQLRTPLTSVKGYISMVLEGDAGKITHMQREMLGQAFFSSQRMVYLIADLLNVSRLKTGKFVIDAAPVNLAEVVEEELGQLEEIAASRSLTLSYNKPKKFPTLMLDETKTRQVIMNFVDNAIYYTPAKGHIEVQLTDKDATIELTVADDGIGVPKAEQPHLFTKFYRAANARKARPDGTGLGLFMAKKVIIAQGGSVIFKSQEGKGSTFGFILSKHALAVPDTPVKEAAKEKLPSEPIKQQQKA